MRTKRKKGNVLYRLVLFALLLFTAFVTFSTFKIPGNYKLFAVQSGSMAPQIKTGSIVLVKPQDKYQKGDVITVTDSKNPRTPITHRIYSIENAPTGAIFQTKGDANDAPDIEKRLSKDILGKVYFSVPYIGFIVSYNKTRDGFIFLVIIPVTVIIYSEMIKIKKELAKFLLLAIIFGLSTMGGTNASYSDHETLNGNIFSAGSIALSLIDGNNYSNILPGFVQTKTIKVVNKGLLNFRYKIDLVMVGEDSSFCEALDIALPPNQPLTISGDEDDIAITISFNDSSASLQNKTCQFNFVFKAWQVDSNGTWGLKDEKVLNSSITSGNWDVTPPTSTITRPFNSNGDNKIQYTYFWNGKVEGTASDDLSGIDHVELSIYRTLLGLYWNGSSWVCGSETGTRVRATGTTSWSYQFNNQPPFGMFRIISHAVDKAGNIENSAVIEFESLEEPVPSLSTSLSPGHHYYSFVVNNITGYAKLSYDITYDTNSAPQGIAGHDNLINQSEYKNENILLGSRSSGGAITFDQGVKNIKITIILTRPDGTTYSLEKTDNQ